MLTSTRDGFGRAIAAAAQADMNLMVLSADVSESLALTKLKQQTPRQYLELGVSEQNMAGVAAGLAMLGKTVVMTSYAMFNPGRNWEQIRLSICEQNLNVKIVGSHSGLATGADGGTHQALEDIALMRVLPNMKVIVPADEDQAAAATMAMLKISGPVYLRLAREKGEAVPTVAPPFTFGRGDLLREGSQATIIACGLMVPLALEAAEELHRKNGLDVGVINLSTIKPLDEELLYRELKRTRAAVTVEDHQIIGGLGGAVAEWTARYLPVPIEMVGVNNQFGQTGNVAQLWEHYGLTRAGIKEKVIAVVKRKTDLS